MSTCYEFEVETAAERVYLADRQGNEPAVLFDMDEREPGKWEAHLQLPPGEHRLRYYAARGRAVTYLGPAEGLHSKTDGWDAIIQVPEGSQNEGNGAGETRGNRIKSAGRKRTA